MEVSGLIIRDPWLSLILNGEKTWELRSTKTKKRGTIALVKSGSKRVFGTCKIINVFGPLSEEDLIKTMNKHQSSMDDISETIKVYKKVYAWELSEVRVFKEPIKYEPKRGAIVWTKVELGDDYACN